MGAAAKKVFGGLTGATLGLAVVAIFGSMVAFNGESFLHDDKLGIELGMQIDATVAEIHVWVHVPRPLYIKTKIANIKKWEDGVGTDGGLSDLFPIGATTFGSGEINFEVFDADEDQMPILTNHTQTLIPMAYIRKASQFPLIVRYVLLFGSYVLNNWMLFKVAIFGQAILLIVAGFGLRYKNKKAKESMVEELKEDIG